MNLYGISATVAVKAGNGASFVRQIPTFYLDANVQGFTDEAGAERVAREIILASRLNGPEDRRGEVSGRDADSTACTVYVTAVAL